MLLSVMFVLYIFSNAFYLHYTSRQYTLHLLASIRTVVKYNITILLYRVVCTLSPSAIDPSALYVPYHTNLYEYVLTLVLKLCSSVDYYTLRLLAAPR